jgi:hypothetical protein
MNHAPTIALFRVVRFWVSVTRIWRICLLDTLLGVPPRVVPRHPNEWNGTNGRELRWKGIVRYTKSIAIRVEGPWPVDVLAKCCSISA